MSSTFNYKLEDITRTMIPLLIGAQGKSLKKNVYVPTWKMFEAYQDKKEDQSSGKHTLKIMINHDSEQGVFATITSDNDILKKFAIHNLKKYTESSLDFFQKKTQRLCHTFYFEFNPDYIPMLVGKKGKYIQFMKDSIVKDYQGKPHTTEDIFSLKKCLIKINNEDISNYETYIQNVEKYPDSYSFPEPIPTKTPQWIISIQISMKPLSDFKDILESTKILILTKIYELDSKKKDLEDSILEALQDIGMNDSYSPASP